MPCSPVTLPPTLMHSSRISWLASRTRFGPGRGRARRRAGSGGCCRRRRGRRWRSGGCAARPTSVMNRRMCGSLVRGTTPSWVQKVGLSRPMAPKADLRLFQIATYSGSLRVRQVIDFATRAAVGLDDLGDRLRLAVEPGVEAVDLDDQDGAGVGREAEVERLLDGLDHQVVEHLERRRDDPGGDDPADGLGRGVDARRRRRARSGPASGSRVRFTIDLGHDAEGPLVADDQAGQVVAGVVLGDAAGLDDRAVGQDELDAPDVVDRHAVLERVRPARVGRRRCRRSCRPPGSTGRGRSGSPFRPATRVSQTLTTPGSTIA